MEIDPDSPTDGRQPNGRKLPRRATDRVEDAVAWLLMATALVVLVISASSGMAVYNRNTELVSALSPARAMLLGDVEVITTEPGTRVPMPVEARWTDRRGVERTGEILVRKPAPAGTEIDVWLDADGEVTPMRGDFADAALAGILTGFLLLFGGSVVLVAAWHGVRRLTAACNACRWEQEWARVGPDWSDRPL